MPNSQSQLAEILLWQGKLRAGFVSAALATWLALRVSNLASGSLAFALWSALSYVAVIGAVTLFVQIRRRATMPLVGLTVAADVALILAVTFGASSPEHYERALLYGFFTIHLTEFHFGQRMAMGALLAVSAGYLTGILVQAGRGVPLEVASDLWLLFVYMLASGIVIVMYGGLRRRLAALARLFERAEEGDFTAAYDESADIRPDAITTVGRAYNRVRVQLAAMVLTDALSGCLNRRGFDEEVTRALARAARSGNEVSLLAIDVDYFKLINDTFGHLGGDDVIREIGTLLRETARTGDVVARVGGEEFMMLLPDTNAAGAFNLATRICEGFRRRAFLGVGGRIPITVSIGVASEGTSSAHIGEDLRARADEALYAAKRTGRNRVVLWTQGSRVEERVKVGR